MSETNGTDDLPSESASISGLLPVDEIRLKETNENENENEKVTGVQQQEAAGKDNAHLQTEEHNSAAPNDAEVKDGESHQGATAQDPSASHEETLVKSSSPSRARSPSAEASSSSSSSPPKGLATQSPTRAGTGAGAESRALVRELSASSASQIQKEDTEEDYNTLSEDEKKKRDEEKVKRARSNFELIKSNIYLSGVKGRSAEESMPCECDFDPRKNKLC
jgi:hypothetical protein